MIDVIWHGVVVSIHIVRLSKKGTHVHMVIHVNAWNDGSGSGAVVAALHRGTRLLLMLVRQRKWSIIIAATASHGTHHTQLGLQLFSFNGAKVEACLK